MLLATSQNQINISIASQDYFYQDTSTVPGNNGM
jgi:hypothetical protein